MKIRLGHCSDADDAYMFYAIAAGKIDTAPYTIETVCQTVQALNDWATRGELEITGLSVHAYAYARNRYLLAQCGGSFGQNCGPKIIAREPSALQDISSGALAVPGNTTSAYLALQLYRPGMRTMLLPPDKIIPAVQMAVVKCALVVHEELLALEQAGLCCLVDLAQWWTGKNDGLPLPLGCYGIRSDLDEPTRRQLEDILRRSIRYAMEHPDEAVEYAAKRSGMSEAMARQYVRAYVTDLSLDLGDRGKRAIERFLDQGREAGIIPNALPLQFA